MRSSQVGRNERAERTDEGARGQQGSAGSVLVASRRRPSREGCPSGSRTPRRLQTWHSWSITASWNTALFFSRSERALARAREAERSSLCLSLGPCASPLAQSRAYCCGSSLLDCLGSARQGPCCTLTACAPLLAHPRPPPEPPSKLENHPLAPLEGPCADVSPLVAVAAGGVPSAGSRSERCRRARFAREGA